MTLPERHNRYRRFFPFQLDINKPDEAEIAVEIENLKRARSFSKTVRDGIRLIADLRNGRVAVLQELFPWVLEQQATPPKTSVQREFSTEKSDLKAQLSRLENLILQQAPPAAPLPKTIDGADKVSFSAPVYDDLELDLGEVKPLPKGNGTQNFLNSLQALQQIKGKPRPDGKRRY